MPCLDYVFELPVPRCQRWVDCESPSEDRQRASLFCERGCGVQSRGRDPERGADYYGHVRRSQGAVSSGVGSSASPRSLVGTIRCVLPLRNKFCQKRGVDEFMVDICDWRAFCLRVFDWNCSCVNSKLQTYAGHLASQLTKIQ